MFLGQPMTAVPPAEEIAEKRLVRALKSLDRPQDWEHLMEIGQQLSAHFKTDMKTWVKKFVLELP